MNTQIRTVKVSSKRQITIPKSSTFFKEGDRVIVISKNDKIIVKPFPKNNDTSILSEKALSESWNSKEDDESFAYLQ